MMHEDRMSGGFRGCVRALYVDGKTVDLTQAKASGHVTLGCPMNAQQGSALLAWCRTMSTDNKLETKPRKCFWMD